MERNANYALVGAISTALLIGLVVFIVWLAGGRFNRDKDMYDVVFQGPVHGVAQGGEVDFNGIKVGSVSKIGLDPKNSQLVIARIDVTTDVPIRKDSVATLEPQGITGVNFIQISAGTPSQPLLKDTVPDGDVPKLASKRDALSDLLAGGGFVVQRTVDALDRINLLLSHQNIKTLGAALHDVQQVTGELSAHKAIIADAESAVQHADSAIAQYELLAKSGNTLINTDAKASIQKLNAALDEVTSATKSLRVTVDKIQGPTQAFAETGLPQLTSSLRSLQVATDHLDRVLGDVEANPRGLIGKAPPKEIEIKP
jgi:phospholipid/cholesterol/gamma-HCH transport system substrate-binding protein